MSNTMLILTFLKYACCIPDANLLHSVVLAVETNGDKSTLDAGQ